MNEVTRESSHEAAAPAVAQDKSRRVVQVPRVDIREGADAYRVVADLPGVGPEGVEATVERNVLTIIGRADREAPDGYRHVYGAPAPTEYRRVFTLSDRIDTTRIEASMKNGTLVLTLPKAVEAQPRRISVA
jgi:HSP20 family molecular chaperone IbpA